MYTYTLRGHTNDDSACLTRMSACMCLSRLYVRVLVAVNQAVCVYAVCSACGYQNECTSLSYLVDDVHMCVQLYTQIQTYTRAKHTVAHTVMFSHKTCWSTSMIRHRVHVCHDVCSHTYMHSLLHMNKEPRRAHTLWLICSYTQKQRHGDHGMNMCICMSVYECACVFCPQAPHDMHTQKTLRD